MPYTKPMEIPFARVARVIKGYATAPVVAEKLMCAPATARARLEKPENLTLGEIKKICERLHIPREEIVSAIVW